MDQTRQLFLGDASLATGFRLAGFEVFPDADAAQLDQLLSELLATRSPAFVVIDQALAASESRRLEEVRRELSAQQGARREAERAFAKSEKERARLEELEAERARLEALPATTMCRKCA